MESNIHSKIVITLSTIILASAFLIVIAGISTTTTFVNVNAQSEGANQTLQQQEDPQQSANQTMEKAFQSANETGEDVGKVGSQVTEGAKDLIGSIGEKLQDLGK
jgi:predicted PurR-regulated permease PerM